MKAIYSTLLASLSLSNEGRQKEKNEGEESCSVLTYSSFSASRLASLHGQCITFIAHSHETTAVSAIEKCDTAADGMGSAEAVTYGGHTSRAS